MEDERPDDNNGKPKQVEKTKEGKVVKRSWRPPSLLDVPSKYKDSRFEYRWITDSMAGNILKRQYEGWEIDTDIAPKMRKDGYTLPTLNDGQLKDNCLRIREQILARIPKKLLAEKREYMKSRNPSLESRITRENEKYKQEVAANLREVYGEDADSSGTYGEIVIK